MAQITREYPSHKGESHKPTKGKQGALIALLLAMLSMVLLLTACDGGGDTQETTPSTDAAELITLIASGNAEYKVIRPDMTTEAVRHAAAKLRNGINEATGAMVGIGNDFDIDESEEALEILVGPTNRTATQNALSLLSDGEYIIALVDARTVVITGKDEIGTVKAVNVFLRTYLGYDDESDTYHAASLTLPSDLQTVAKVFDPNAAITENADGTLTLIDADPTYFKVVYPENAPERVKSSALALQARINAVTGVDPAIGVSIVSDSADAHTEGAFEILVGATNREASVTALEALSENQYTVQLLDKHTLVLVGTDEYGTAKAVRQFCEAYLPYDTESKTYTVKKLSVPSAMRETANTVDPKAIHDLGLQVSEDGTITLGGKAFQAIGVNWHGAFDRIYYHPDETDMDRYFKTLKDNGIPYFRLQMGIFYDHEYKEYDKNTKAYFKAMDELVKLAEKYEIGMICSLMWMHSALWKYCDEDVTALADENSKTIAFARRYVTDVISRYRTSPAIWGWEIGNEGNCDADILEGMSTAVLTTYYRLIGETMHELDASRLLTAGDSYPRSSSNSLRELGSWFPEDTREDVMESFMLYTPDPLNCISVHIYGDKNADAKIEADIIDLRAKTNELGIGAFVGEFGPGSHEIDNPLDAIGPEDPREAEEQAYFKKMVDLFLENDVQVLCAWSYGRYIQQPGDATSIEYGMLDGVYQNAHMFEYIVEKNAELKASGVNCAEEYWENIK